MTDSPQPGAKACSLERFDLLTLSEVAELLHCSKAHVGRVIAGRVHGCQPIPALRLGRRTLVRRETLLAWIEGNESSDTIPRLPVRGAGLSRIGRKYA
jgi:excisionase family DNA binding protein